MHRHPSVTAVCHQVVKDAPSGLDAQTVADLVNKPYATLMSELSRQPGHKLGADIVLPLCAVTESTLPVRVMCRALGGAFVPVRMGEGMPAAILETLAVSVREFGEFAAEAAESIADGRMSATESENVARQGYEAIEAILAMIRLAREAGEQGRK